MKKYPETIEHRWDILYSDYPEIYDRFTSFPYTPSLIEMVTSRFDLTGKVVLDNGAGTGESAIALSVHADEVIGVEPEAAMRVVADENIAKLGSTNVRIVEGRGQAIPLPNASADVFTTFTGGLQSIPEAKRVLRRPGIIVSLDIAPNAYGGELCQILEHPTPELQRGSDFLVKEQGFSCEDIETVQEYGSVENILETYGFIFGRKAIDYLKSTQQTSIRWTFRMHYLNLA